MTEIVIKIKFDDENGYKGHGDDTAELIKGGIENYLEIDLEHDGVIEKGWSVEIMDNSKKMLDELHEKYGFKEITIENGQMTLNPVYKKHLNKTKEIEKIYGLVSNDEISLGKARELTSAIIESAVTETSNQVNQNTGNIKHTKNFGVYHWIKHTKNFGVYHWDTFDNEIFLKYEHDDFNKCVAWTEDHYRARLTLTGADQVDIVDKEGNIIKRWNVV